MSQKNKHLDILTRWSRCILPCLLLFLLSGCVQILTLEVVDAKSHQPLSNVNVKWGKVRYSGFMNIDCSDVKNLKTTNGVVKIVGVSANDNINLYCDGYWPANVFLGGNYKLQVTSPVKQQIISSKFTNNANIRYSTVIELYRKE